MLRRILFVCEDPLLNQYKVSGDSFEKAMELVPRERVANGLEYTGYTRSWYRWHYRDDCFIVRMTTVIDLPVLMDAWDSASLKWQHNLKCHEMVHFNINKQGAISALKMIKSRLPLSYEECERLFQEHWLMVQDKKHLEFDSETNHGCTRNKYCGTIDACYSKPNQSRSIA